MYRSSINCQHLRYIEQYVEVPETGEGQEFVQQICSDCGTLITSFLRSSTELPQIVKF